MMIRCDYVTCTVDCKYYYVCNLYEPSNLSLTQLELSLKWNVNRLYEINKEINHFHTTLFQLKHNELSEFIKKHISENKIKTKLKQLHIEKKEIIQTIKEQRTQEKNIKKILKRRKLK